MICTNCGKNLAVFHTTKIVNNKTIEVHLCNDCMAQDLKLEMDNKSNYFNPIITSHSCRTCGCTFEEFSKSGLLGCPDCYEYFKEELKNVIIKLQGSTMHYGKSNSKGNSEEEKEYMELNRQLKDAVFREDYELASQLKEQILKLRDIDGFK